MVGVLDKKFCPSAKTWKAQYEATKVYLGVNRTLRAPVSVTLAWHFKSRLEEREFFTFWANETHDGAKPFYVLTGLYGERKYYLVSLDGSLSHAQRSLEVSGKFTLYRMRTLEENTAPILNAQQFDVQMDSTNNFIHIRATDYDQIRYDMITAPAHGTYLLQDGGILYYTPEDGFFGTDTFRVRVTDELGVTAEAIMSIEVVNWKLAEEFKLLMDATGHLHIDYVHPDTIAPSIKSAVDDLSLGMINHKGEYVIDETQSAFIGDVHKTADDEWVITIT